MSINRKKFEIITSDNLLNTIGETGIHLDQLSTDNNSEIRVIRDSTINV